MAEAATAETQEAVQTTFCGIKDRLFGAACEHASARLHEPKDQQARQLTDLKFHLYNLSPEDLVNSCLGPLAFPPRRRNDQLHLDEAGKTPSEIMAITGEYKPGPECESRGFNVLIYPSKDYGMTKPYPIELTPQHGIAVKKMLRSDEATEANPFVDLIIMAKGLSAEEAGRIEPAPWLQLAFEVGFRGKRSGGQAPEEEDGEEEAEEE